MNEYQQQLLDHYHSPRNFGAPSFEATHNAKVSNLSCGDEIEIWLEVSADKIIKNVAFSGEGCSIAIGSASLLLEELKGKTLNEVENLNEDFQLKLIGIPLTMARLKCATLPFQAVKNSIG